jgi:hypothetical protein
MPATAHKHSLQTTTVRLPRWLYDEARKAVEDRKTDANSLNELLVNSLNATLKKLTREEIDADFASMRNDAQYRRESDTLTEQFATNDAETLKSAERVSK